MHSILDRWWLLVFASLLPGLSHAEPPPGLKPSGPVECRADEELKISDLHITAKKDGVTVLGNCDIVIENVHVDAAGVALRVLGNGDVTLRRSRLFGGRAAIHVGGNGTVKASENLLVGGVRRRNNGEFVDQGDNRRRQGTPPDVTPPAVDRREPPPAVPPQRPRELRETAPIRCTGVGHRKVSGVRIRTDGDAVTLNGTCSITIIDSEIVAGGVAIRAMGTGKVKLVSTKILGRRAAIDVVGSGDVVARESTIEGPVLQTGAGRFVDRGGNTIR